ncbi:hypothetical protein ACHAXS_009202 [Conticribra weissflogii]
MTPIPTIHLDGSSKEAEIVNNLRDACTHVGFFYLEGHSIHQSLLDEVLAKSQVLFALPMDQKISLSDSNLQRGYTRSEEETLDPINQRSRGDTKEGYYIGSEVDVKDMDPAKLCGPNVWPSTDKCRMTDEECNQFRKVMEEYRSEATKVCMSLLPYFALAAGSDDRHLFDEFFEDPGTIVRLLHYSSEPSAPDEGIYACGAHSDYGMITLLLTDENPGLQVKLNNENWIDIPPRKGAFVVNIGDMFERWTNGKFRSTVHRVLTPLGGNERYSVPFFFEPDFDALVECLDVCCSEYNPPKFPPITAGQHLLNMYGKTHADFFHSAENKSTT